MHRSCFFLRKSVTVSAYISEADVAVGYDLVKTVIVTTAIRQIQHRFRLPTVNIRTVRFNIQLLCCT
jgi:hypothetical protein